MLALESCLLTGMGKPIAYYAEPMDVFERKVNMGMGPGMCWRIASKSATSAIILTKPTRYSPRCRNRGRCRVSLRPALRLARDHRCRPFNKSGGIAFSKHQRP